MSLVPKEDIIKGRYYLPHHPRFRIHPVAINADIAKMYRQIRISQEDSEFQRIVWRNDPHDKIKDYRLETVTYGTSCAPFLATRIIKQLALDEQITGTFSVDEGKNLVQELYGLLSAGGFELRKWTSNVPDVLSLLPNHLRSTNTNIGFEESKQFVNVLGLQWQPRTDGFTFKGIALPLNSMPKREILSQVAKIFDPLGWISPFTTTIKLILQELWKTGLEWDDPIPEELRRNLTLINQDLPSLEHIQIPRCVVPGNFMKCTIQKVYRTLWRALPGFKMDKLKKACETKKRTLESVIAEADGELGKQEPSLEMLMSLRPKLLRCKDRFLIASDCLIEQLIKADREDEEIEDVDIVQANLFGRSEGVLQKMEQLLAKPTVDRESIVSGGNEGKSNLHRLPKLELPKFGGEAREWLQFWSAFQSVHDDDSISACVKFQYLQNCMIKGSVSEEIVSSFPNSAANYPLAISTLKERFGREDMLVEVYVRDLIAITLENAHGSNTTPFSTVYVRLSSQLRALGSLGVTTDKCAAILYPMVESALPEDLFVAWERTRHHHKPDEDGKHNSSEALLEKLMEFLKHEVEGSERMRLARQPFSSSYPSQFNRDKPPKPKTSVATAASLIDGENKSKVVRAMLDSGSQNSYVLEQTASEVGLTMLGKKKVVHLLFGGVKSRPQQHKRYRIYISDVDSKYNCNFEVQDCSTICSAMPSAQPTEWMTELRSKGIDLDVYRSNTEIELLLGADVYAKLLTGKKIELESGPVALETKLGWTSVMQQYKIFGD
ncbi:hypothetical protein LAZ67_18001351 [Cordylochernes scorpioides]|uniref:Peptidase aspartic putative domain-containing protein n=1 Tax=Cordylochernes scorpioides TaxID=51811 RepID=A0ABY6LFP1_9ARAC|nr:hypothetical protein LAZ67_18001351 [Cordylochernes scorpioides]